MPDHHIVASFDLDLHNLRRTLGEMGGTAETMLKDAMVAFARRDVSSAEAVVAADRGLDRSQRGLLIVRRQPMAMDLREVISAIRIAGDIERIGDMAKNIAKRVLAIRDEPRPDGLAAGIRRLADMVLEQLRNVLDAYDRRDDEAALKVWQSDASIDALYTALFRETLAFMVEDPHRNHAVHSPPVLRQEHRARRRSCDQHRRDRALSRHGREPDGAPQAGQLVLCDGHV